MVESRSLITELQGSSLSKPEMKGMEAFFFKFVTYDEIIAYYERAYNYKHFEKPSGLYDENCARGTHLKFTFMMTQHFRIRHNKLIGRREIWLFLIVVGDLRCF